MWIGKAVQGLTGEKWRPLSVSTTFWRTITGAIFQHIVQNWEVSLQESQTLAGTFKEARANYKEAQGVLDHALITRGKGEITAVLLMDKYGSQLMEQILKITCETSRIMSRGWRFSLACGHVTMYAQGFDD